MRGDYAKFQEVGGEVAVVTMGTAEQAAAFRQRYDLPFPVLADPERRAYKAFELERGSLRQIAGPSIWWKGLKALFRGGVGKPTGDVKQMPGAFVIGTDGVVRFAHYANNSADEPDHEAMIRAARAAAEN